MARTRTTKLLLWIGITLAGCGTDTQDDVAEEQGTPIPESPGPDEESALAEKTWAHCPWIFSQGYYIFDCDNAGRQPAGQYTVDSGSYGYPPSTPCGRTFHNSSSDGWFNPDYETTGNSPFFPFAGCKEFEANPLNMCKPGWFAYAFAIKQETYQGGGDDTGLNQVALYCYSKDGSQTVGEWMYSNGQQWGSWLPTVTPANYSTTNPLIGMEIKNEGQQGSGDDGGASTLRGRFLDNSVVASQNHANVTWGAWRGMKSCPSGQAVCGLSAYVEDSQGSGDDTALNGLKIACCPF
jgi:hypothetical protein